MTLFRLKRLSAHHNVYPLLLLLAVSTVLAFSLSFRLLPAASAEPPRGITEFKAIIDGEKETALVLPTKLSPLKPHTAVTLTTEISVEEGDRLFLKSVFAPLRVYIADQLVLEMGQKGSFPPYLNDPPTMLTTIPLEEHLGKVELRLEYLSLTQRKELSLPALLLGSESALLFKQLKTNGFSFFFSLLLILIGLLLALTDFSILRKLSKRSPFLWLGLFSFSAGVWIFGECDLTGFLLPYPSFFYVLEYLGLFFMTIPLLQFGLIIINPKNKAILRACLHLLYSALFLATILQFAGLMDFTRSLYWFHILAPCGFSLLAATLLWELFRHGNPAAKRFSLAVILLAVSTVLELINYYFQFTTTLTFFFQLGMLAFIVALGIVAGHYLRNALLEKSNLEYQVLAARHQLELQRLQYRRITEKEDVIQRQTHDLRHHLAVIKGLHHRGEREKLEHYLKTLIQQIPEGREIRFSENPAVNAVASYYAEAAKSENIEADIKLAVPQELESVLESDLCIVIGNLLENAVEACSRMSEGERTLRVKSNLEQGTLTLIVENSFAGDPQMEKGHFLSSKRPGKGIGLTSVEALAEKYGGRAKFEARLGIFRASVFLQLPEKPGKGQTIA